MANRRVLTLTPASVTVIANMIGTGIFTTTGLMAGMGASGGDILLAWLLGGVIAICGALCYGEIGANLPHSGGEYYYLSRLLHPSLGFISGVVSLLSALPRRSRPPRSRYTCMLRASSRLAGSIHGRGHDSAACAPSCL